MKSKQEKAMSALVAGQLEKWPTKERMATILREAGLTVSVGSYSIRVDNCSHFVFREYGGDLGDPAIDADADTPEELIREARLVSDALARAGIKHSFEVYDHDGKLVGYLHHNWSQES